jgi:hypothetical protein
MELMLFDEVADALRDLVPLDLGDLRCRSRRWAIKVWFDTDAPPREHYEAQIIGPRDVPEASVLAIELGFHAENRQPADNDAVLARLLTGERKWRPVLGDEAVAGPFLGRADDWRRLSEVWPDPDLSDPETGIEIATRLTDYLIALEPLRRGGGRGVGDRSGSGNRRKPTPKRARSTKS